MNTLTKPYKNQTKPRYFSSSSTSSSSSPSMASSKHYRYLSNNIHTPIQPSPIFEFNESDIWNHNNNATTRSSPELRKPVSNNRVLKKQSSPAPVIGATAASLPVNVPDCRRNRTRNDVVFGEYDDVFDEFDECFGQRVPPHVFLARTRTTSFSVHEGVGRTLKGRDLSRVRNAVWEKIGFQD